MNESPFCCACDSDDERYRIPLLQKGSTKAIVPGTEDNLISPTARTPDSARQMALLGHSPAIHKLNNQIAQFAQSDCPVLILGESGTGKEITARAIHRMSRRATGPFIAVDCAALTATLIESELFGHTKGAFTGAVQDSIGLIEAANRGTLFLDEIGDLPKDLQPKLLRMLQEKQIRPIGSSKSRSVDMRIVAATNVDLRGAVKRNEFRLDLYYRLKILQLTLPPLRERKSDIPYLVDTFLEKHAAKVERNLSEGAWRKLMSWDWPGNIRELENAVQAATAKTDGPVLQEQDFELDMLPELPAPTPGLRSLEAQEQDSIRMALISAAGNKAAAAKMLGIGKTTIYRKIKTYENSPISS